MDAYLRPAAALFTGAALIFAFQPYDLWFFTVPVVAAFTLIVRDQTVWRAARLGLLTGLGFFVPFLPWIGDEVGPIPWLLLSSFQALFFAPLGVAVMLLQRLPAWPLLTAAAWVAEEAVRGRLPWGGFTWGKLAFSQVDGPMLGIAAVAGSPGVSFAVALAGAIVAWAILARPAWQRTAAALGAGAIVLVGLVLPTAQPGGERVTVASVQGNTPGMGLDFNARRRVILDNHVEVTHRLAEQVRAGTTPQPDIVIWPENSSDINPYADADAHAAIQSAVTAIGVPTLVGSVVPTPDGTNVENTSIVWDPAAGPGQTYVKRHPMPFGEYIPFRTIARRIAADAVDRQPRDFVAGQEVGVLDMAGIQVGGVICFEVAFDNLARDAVRDGAEVLAVQTNNAGFGYSPMTEQMLAMGRLRAVEHGRWTFISALAGVSAVVDPSGAVTQRIELFEQGVMIAEVDLADSLTVATTIGEWPEWLVTALAVSGLALAAMRARTAPPRQRVHAEQAPVRVEVDAR